MREYLKAIVFFFLLSHLVSAQTPGEILGAKWSWVLCNILCVIFFIAAAVSAVVIAFAGLKYLTAESSEQRNDAKRRISFAILGLFIVMLSILFVNYLVSVSKEVKTFSCICTTLWSNSSVAPYSNLSSSLTVEIIYPGDGSEFEEDTDVQFLGYVYQGAPSYEYSWSSNPSEISRKVTKDYSMDSFSKELPRGEYVITLTVTDGTGKIATDSVKINVIVPKPPT